MNDELDMLEIRIEELWDVVDYFIIVEARRTFQNSEKPLYFDLNKSKFEKYASKIIHVALDQGSDVVIEWENEVYFRNAIGHFGIPQIEKKRGIKVRDSDIIMVGDIDEIPDHRVISFLGTYQGYPTTSVFSLRWSYYSFLWLNKNKLEGTVAVTVGDLRKFNSDLNTNWVRYNRLEKQGKDIWVIGRMGLWAGWHCSWCMPPENMVRKLESYAHNQLQYKPGAKDLDILKERRKNGVWIDSEIVEGDRVTYTGLPDDLVAPQYLFTPKAKQKFSYMFD
jgi:beta-1,4-mannosyl-glycoprotein beta-1,4-N-acetylglucosaminyltransferase